MRNTTLVLTLGVLLAGCGGGGAATGPGDGGGQTPTFASLSVSPGSGDLTVGGTLALTATPLDGSGNPLSGLPAPRWESSNPSVARVDGSGTVTAVAAGNAVITASLTAAGTTRTGTAQVAVTVSFAAVRLSHSDFTAVRGSTHALSATAVDAAGNPLPGAPAATWQSSAPAVVSISGGVATAHADGSALVTASVTYQGVTRSGTVRITVGGSALPSSATVKGIHHGFSPSSVTIAVGGTVTWVMTEDEEHDITWEGAAPPGGNIPRLDEDERASRTFPTAGTYTYRCDHHDSRVEAGTVIVQAGGGGSPPVLTSVTVAPGPASVAVGATVQLTATPRDQFGNPMTGLAAAGWQSSDPSRATVSGTGLVSGVAAGTATITATVTHQGTTRSGTATVNVGTSGAPNTATVRTVERTFSPRSVTIANGGSVTWQFDATHNVTFRGSSPSGGSIGNQSSGSATRQFTSPGTYSYECTLHSGMTGSVVVQ